MQVFQRFDEQVAAKMDARKDLSMELIAPIKENKEEPEKAEDAAKDGATNKGDKDKKAQGGKAKIEAARMTKKQRK